MSKAEPILFISGSCLGILIAICSALLPIVVIVALTKYIMGW